MTGTFLVAALAAFGVQEAPAAPRSDEAKRLDLKVLYAGPVDTPRAATFVEFLKQHFATVDALDVTKLSMKTAAPYDVVVADGKRQYPMSQNGGIDLPTAGLGPEFTKPVVVISAQAGTIQHHTKLDWL